MITSTANLVLNPVAKIDLQLHTILSDGKWTPETLIDHLISEDFALAAITDHDRVDTAAHLQAIALEKHFPLLVAAEMTTRWHDSIVDVLCFGFDPDYSGLQALTADLLRRQRENIRAAYDQLLRTGCPLPEATAALDALLALPSAAQPPALFDLVMRSEGLTDDQAFDRVVKAGSRFVTTDIALVVETVHQAGGVVLIAHPGRGDGYIPFTVERLDQLRAEVPIDGFEVYYPVHSPEQTTLFREYASQHHLLTSSGSDSHSDAKLPIAYPAYLSKPLLERLGITIAGYR
ncbi:MAG: PHP domain-containing protein [Anaerolineae bacterium]